jgi:hypothetical protein
MQMCGQSQIAAADSDTNAFSHTCRRQQFVYELRATHFLELISGPNRNNVWCAWPNLGNVLLRVSETGH